MINLKMRTYVNYTQKLHNINYNNLRKKMFKMFCKL